MKTLSKIEYDAYKDIQIKRATRKWGSVSFWDNIIYFQDIVTEINRTYGQPKNICCMGIRNGNEYKGFKETVGFKGTEIYGVDIHPKVTEVGENCFCYDFTMLPKEWEKKFDWVYSNSLDHSFDVEKTLKEWHRVCKKYVIIELSSCGKVAYADRYDFEMSDIDTLFDKNLFKVLKVWDKNDVFKAITVLLEIL